MSLRERHDLAISAALTDGTQAAYVVFTTTYPCRVSDLRMKLQFKNDKDIVPGFAKIHGGLILVRDGYTASTQDDDHLSRWYQPNNHVILHSYVSMSVQNLSTEVALYEMDESDVLRIINMQVGDTIVLIVRSEGMDIQSVRGFVRFIVTS